MSLPPEFQTELSQNYLRHLGALNLAQLSHVPDFLIISPPKTGTTWLAENLRAHPDIFIPEEKELHYFTAYWRHFDISWYLKFFENAVRLQKGEASTGYGALPRFAVELIYRLNPKMKLIYLIRHPVERTWSQARHQYQHRASAEDEAFLASDLDETILAHIDSDTHYHSNYVRDLRCWLSVFPKEQFYVGFYETIGQDPVRLLREIFAHLDVAPVADWASFSAFTVIHPGLKHDTPQSVVQALKHHYQPSALALAEFLRNQFRLELPSNWCELIDGAAPRQARAFEMWATLEADIYPTGKDDPFFDPGPAAPIIAPPLFFRGYYCAYLPPTWYASLNALNETGTQMLDEHNLRAYLLHSQSFVGTSFDDLKQAIEIFSRQSSPELIEKNYLGFNLVAYQQQVFGLALTLGVVDLAQVSASTLAAYQAQGACFVGASLEAVKQAIAKFSPPSPMLIEENYLGFNLVAYQQQVFGLALTLGPVDLGLLDTETLATYQSQGVCVVGATAEAAKRLIAQQNSGVAPSSGRHEQALLIGNLPAEKLEALRADWPNYECLTLFVDASGRLYLWSGAAEADRLPTTIAQLRQQAFDVVIIPYEGRLYWHNQNLITLTTGLASKTLLVFADSRSRMYQGEDVHRLEYNAAYLNRMFQFVPPLAGKRLLDVGCSDGLVCDLLSHEAPEAITGIDVLSNVGGNYSNPRITYFNMDASQMRFEDRAFDVCYCIAVLEHVQEPVAVLREMKRVTRRGGYGYVQAGPLYFSPYGHHMFGYFDDYPWIHLRLSKPQIAAYAHQHGIAPRIHQAANMTVEAYLDGIFTADHLNGRRLADYHLDQFMSDPEIEVLSFTKSFEGETLLTPTVLQTLTGCSTDDLITHGFELIFRVK